VRVLFLDIDGVLNRNDWEDGDPHPARRTSCVRQLNRTLEQTGAAIVLASNWRDWIVKRSMTMDGFEFLLRTHGVTSASIVGVTSERQHCRSREIVAWLRNHPEIASFAILDDQPEGPEPDWVRSRLVRTKSTKGLTAQEARQAIKLLSMLDGGSPLPDERSGLSHPLAIKKDRV
jgi:hypothetical protein